MAFTYSVNNRPTTGGFAMYTIVAAFLAAGWTKKMDSDGTTYSSSGTQVTGGNTGTNGLNNAYAWVRMADPAGVREFVIERSGSVDYQWGIKYSAAAHFTGGSPGAAALPTATDEVAVLGTITGSGGSGGTYASFFSSTEASYYLHCVLGDSTIGYGFWFCCGAYKNTASTSTEAGWFMDVLTGYDTGDADPSVHMAISGSNFGGTIAAGDAKCFFGAVTSANFKAVTAAVWANASYGGFGIASWPVGMNWWNGYEDVMPVLWSSTAASTGWKGWSTLFQWTSNNSHIFGTAISIGNPPTFGNKDHIVLNGVALPWQQGVDPIN
jgi:hypothetical protein